MLALVVDLPIERTYLRKGSMKLTHGRGKHYLTQIRVVIILVLSCFVLLSIVQKVENRKNIRWERNLLYQERTYEVQEQRFFLFFFYLNIHPHMPLQILMQKYLHEKRSEIISDKINELLMKRHLVMFLRRLHPHNTRSLSRYKSYTNITIFQMVQIFIPIHASKKT